VFGEFRDPPTAAQGLPLPHVHRHRVRAEVPQAPLAAALVRRQMKVLDKRNAMIKAQVRRINDTSASCPA